MSKSGRPREKKAKTRLATLPRLKARLWELCKEYVRQRDKGICQACGATGLEGANAQTSHLIASSICGGYLRYDHRNLYLCCYRCNISLSGNIASLYCNIERVKGKAFIERLFQDKQRIIQLDRPFLMAKIAEYEVLRLTEPLGNPNPLTKRKSLNIAATKRSHTKRPILA